MTDYADVIDFVYLAREEDTGAPVTILVLDTENAVAQDLSPDLARALARKLTALADEYERYKPLRRPVALNESLLSLE